jgi:hypothetical protein
MVLIGLIFMKLKGENGSAIGIVVRYIKVELTSSKRHDASTVRNNKVSVSHDFVLVKCLHAYGLYQDYLCEWRT